MKEQDVSYFNIGPRLKLTFALFVSLILVGNALLIWQFHLASLQTDRLTGVSQQVIEVLRLQQSLRTFHRRLEELAQSKDAFHLAAEAEPLRRALLEQTQRTRNALAHLPSETPVDPAFLPALEAIETTLPSQLEAITALAKSGDWEAVHLRLDNELKPVETPTSALIESLDQEVSGQLAEAVANMRRIQNKILLIVPATAISTFCIAAFFGWAMSRRIVALRLEERVSERTRIARELHDTLLQSVVSASMQLHVAGSKLPEDSPARPLFSRVLQLLGQMIEESRNAVRGYRIGERDAQDLERAFSMVPQELDVQQPIDFRVIVEGHPQSVHPLVRDEVYSIGREALVNSFRHSGARRIEVELEFSDSQLRVVVRDDGCGIDTRVLQHGRAGHWGLSGMRERAESIGGKLKVMSHPSSGTETELSVPGRVAFESPVSGRAAAWLSKLNRRKRRSNEPPDQDIAV